MIIRLEIYIEDYTGTLVNVWRRTIYDFKSVPVGMKFLLVGADRQKWLFPGEGIASGEHYDTHNDVYVVWAKFNEPYNFKAFGFDELHRERWP